MTNPWLELPLSDYEQHMALPHVGQARMLADEFEHLLRTYEPASVAVIGCAGGNGFERITPARIHRVVGVDLNPAYLAEAAQRFDGVFDSLELIAGDVCSEKVTFAPVDLIYAGLIFEYVAPASLLARLRNWLHPEGILAVLLQLPAEHLAEVTPSPFKRLQTLASILHLVPPATLAREAAAAGFVPLHTKHIALTSGKSFDLLTFTVH